MPSSSCHPHLPKDLVEKLRTDPVYSIVQSCIYDQQFEQFRISSLTGPCKDRAAFEVELVLDLCQRDRDAPNPIIRLTPNMRSFLPPQLRTIAFTMGQFSAGDSKTWLHFAAFYADVPVAYEIIRMGIDINKTDKGGATALLIALAQVFVLQLADLGFNFLPPQNGSQVTMSSFNLDKYLGCYVHIAALLIEQHADVNTGAYGFTPLSLAVNAHRWDLVELLLRHGARHQPIQDFQLASPADITHFQSILSQISPSKQRPPQKCPCWSGKPLSDCHDSGQSKPRPEHFLCSCGRRKTYGNCCKKKGIKIKEHWDHRERWITSREETTVHLSPLNDIDTSNMVSEVKPLLDMAIQPDLYEIGLNRLVDLYPPQVAGEPFQCPARVLRPLAKGLGLEDRFCPGWWYAYEQTDFTPQYVIP